MIGLNINGNTGEQRKFFTDKYIFFRPYAFNRLEQTGTTGEIKTINTIPIHGFMYVPDNEIKLLGTDVATGTGNFISFSRNINGGISGTLSNTTNIAFHRPFNEGNVLGKLNFNFTISVSSNHSSGSDGLSNTTINSDTIVFKLMSTTNGQIATQTVTVTNMIGYRGGIITNYIIELDCASYETVDGDLLYLQVANNMTYSGSSFNQTQYYITYNMIAGGGGTLANCATLSIT